jgi:hypothetical protein
MGRRADVEGPVFRDWTAGDRELEHPQRLVRVSIKKRVLEKLNRNNEFEFTKELI